MEPQNPGRRSDGHVTGVGAPSHGDAHQEMLRLLLCFFAHSDVV